MSPWERLRVWAGPTTSGQRWTAGVACVATAFFLVAGLPAARTVTDDAVTGMLDTGTVGASSPAGGNDALVPSPASAGAEVTSGMSAPAGNSSLENSSQVDPFRDFSGRGSAPTSEAPSPPSDDGNQPPPSGGEPPPTTQPGPVPTLPGLPGVSLPL